MRAADVPKAAIDSFRHYYRQLVAGESGLLPEGELEPLDAVPSRDELPSADGGG